MKMLHRKVHLLLQLRKLELKAGRFHLLQAKSLTRKGKRGRHELLIIILPFISVISIPVPNTAPHIKHSVSREQALPILELGQF